MDQDDNETFGLSTKKRARDNRGAPFVKSSREAEVP
jgi:hypothetical protein